MALLGSQGGKNKREEGRGNPTRALQRVLHSPLDTFFQHIFLNLATLQDSILN